MILKLARNILGQVIVFISFITRPTALKRAPDLQKVVNQQTSFLSLYQLAACPFCTKTRRTLHRLNLPIELKSVKKGSPARSELLDQGGKIQVPCLRIDTDGSSQWIYESKQIVEYLEQQFAPRVSQ
jgi:glutaredoxin